MAGPSPPRIRFRDQLRWGRSRDGTCGSGKFSGKIGSFWKSPIFVGSFLKSKKFGWPSWVNHYCQIVWKSSSKMTIGSWFKLLTSKQQNKSGHFWWWFHRTSAIWNEGQVIQMMVSQPKNLGNWSSLCSIKPISCGYNGGYKAGSWNHWWAFH